MPGHPTIQTGSPAINCWIYFLGEMNGEDIKIGRSTGKTVAARIAEVNGDQTTNASYQILAGLRGDPKDEGTVKRYFDDDRRRDKGRRTEYFVPARHLAEYINWLRQWWWVSITGTDTAQDVEAISPDLWLPAPERRLTPPEPDPGVLIQPYVDLDGPLAGTPWAWMISPRESIQDYFTPTELVDAAREAMGGIDLDAASHPIANRRHRIPDYFHINRSAFDNDWHGRVWLNPPYGNNAPWFERILHFLGTGEIRHLCMLSPMWAFTTEQAKPIMRESAATVLLSPTPKFWGNSEGRQGMNHPHAVVYFGDRVQAFLRAFTPFGIPLKLAWEHVDAFQPREDAA